MKITRRVIENVRRKEENKIKYEILSKELGIKINTENQYQLAMMGATSEIIQKDEIPSDLYKIAMQNNNHLLLPKNL